MSLGIIFNVYWERKRERESQITPLYHLERQCSSQSCRPSNKTLVPGLRNHLNCLSIESKRFLNNTGYHHHVLVVFKMLMLKIACTLDRIEEMTHLKKNTLLWIVSWTLKHQRIALSFCCVRLRKEETICTTQRDVIPALLNKISLILGKLHFFTGYLLPSNTSKFCWLYLKIEIKQSIRLTKSFIPKLVEY